MQPIAIAQASFASWGTKWLARVDTDTEKAKATQCFSKKQAVNFATFIDREVADRLAEFLGGIPVVPGHSRRLGPPAEQDCVEMGPVRVIGGIRPQNFDVAYRPDGVRVVFDSKSLNDKKSIAKNWQNMINDLATEASTVHTRFPYSLVGFAVVLPEPALRPRQRSDLVRTLERLATRRDVLDQVHLAESIALVIWDPATGSVDSAYPPPGSVLRVESFSERLYPHYVDRYKGLPPHD